MGMDMDSFQDPPEQTSRLCSSSIIDCFFIDYFIPILILTAFSFVAILVFVLIWQAMLKFIRAGVPVGAPYIYPPLRRKEKSGTDEEAQRDSLDLEYDQYSDESYLKHP